ncbi:MAG: 3-dehydroquinate synthase [Acidimicrobiales bacterium]|nr:3-dehydroquinate synthase [Acidimicrobiales bacterium]MYD83421.1 3-dehydroquinate synthase [Acidimicrobiales bacterium]MYJ64255.1 3-dehydroquinate synthase [Acidimicrobiales bacterium]
MSGTIRIDVPLGDRSYPVLVGADARHELAPILRESKLTAGAQRAAVVTQPGIGIDVDPGIPFEIFEIPDGEQAKELASIGELCSGFTRFGLTRRDVVVSVGGGVVTDVAGFAAAVYHRGVAVVHVATTLLGQIDAAVGGKTGVNLAEGKNLVGAFWQPAAVLCDTEVLDTLPERELRAGLGELAKYHFIGSPAAQRWLAKTGGGDLAELPIDERVAACVAIKAEVVASDETESGRRALLNYGHTLGHALEIAGRFDLRHGEAVAIGLRYAAEVARLLGRIGDDRVAEHESVLDAYGLSWKLPPDVDHDEIIELFGRDKKAADGITFVLDGPDGLEVVPGIDPGVLRSALERM